MSLGREIAENAGAPEGAAAAGLYAVGLSGLAPGPFTLRVDAGRCVAITGPSGSGKTLLLRMIADLDPHSGEVRLGDHSRSEMASPAWRRLVTYVASDAGWWARTVGEHFADPAAARDLLPQVGLDGAMMDADPSRLSSGERQRLALLRAIVQAPEFLLLDEPTSALDEVSTQQVERLLLKVMNDGCGILMVSHNLDQARRLADRHYRLTVAGMVECPS